MNHAARRGAVLIALGFATSGPAAAQGAPPVAAQGPPPVAAQSRLENGPAPSARAVTLAITYNSDANADVFGGRRKGTAYLQRVGIIGDADLARAVGWRGATAHVSIQSIVGKGLSASRVGNLLTVSGIEAPPALRLFNLWFEQKLGSASLRAGQFTAGQEFAISPTASLFVNSTFGWPGSFAIDLPGGGPAYPIAVPGLRLAATADSGRTTARAALFTGNPPGRDVHGLAGWRLERPPLAIAEIVRAGVGDDPAWTVTIGGWVSFDRYADLRTPANATMHGDRAVYAIVDGRLWQRGGRSLHAFARVTASPADRNLIRRYADAGVTLAGAIASRPSDVIGLAAAAAFITPIGGRSPPPEKAIELSYQAHLGANFYLQPNVQAIIDVYDPDRPAPSTPNRSALVGGVRTSLRF
ncbi:carbohydrate porin [Sphingomonas faeni]|uniref:carbohydrate porin n=1 Tax=Sphingomonas faeni TaxID=185950 RepID=UPI002782B3B6|nr:carbohydrate porin [Sphingomonas faeni]MDQ0839299.1 porin [Sphingomonas faeni]